MNYRMDAKSLEMPRSPYALPVGSFAPYSQLEHIAYLLPDFRGIDRAV